MSKVNVKEFNKIVLESPLFRLHGLFITTSDMDIATGVR